LFRTGLILLVFSFVPKGFGAEPNLTRFFIMGDGTLVLSGQTISYRDGQNQYLEVGLKKINRLFGSPWTPEYERLSTRFIEVLDYVQDQLQGGGYQIRSGYRSPGGNQSLRTRGKLAAQSSMHVEAAAGDLFLSGVPSSKVFEFVKSLNCCGIGWYHSRHFHLDTGPPRYWDEKSSKTEDQAPQQNEKIILQPDWDRAEPGATLPLKFMRVTEYPIGVPEKFTLLRLDGETVQAKIQVSANYSSSVTTENSCRILQDRAQARQVAVTLPATDLPPGSYALEVAFCKRYGYERMPETIQSRPFEIVTERKQR
jgi:uncharacterized protein YcbK (DUF882 family)